MEERKRNYLIDNLKVLLIFFVVLGHVIEYYIQDNIMLRSIYIFIYFFHMPLFVFVSGYLSKNVQKSSKGTIKSLLIPYIVFNIIWYSLVYLVTSELMLLIIYPGWTLWYLISLFFWRVSLKYLVRFKYILPMSIIGGLLVGALPRGGVVLSLSRTITFLPFFLLGYYTSETHLKKISKIGKGKALLGVGVAIVLAFYVGKTNSVDYSFFYHSKSYVSSGISTYVGVFLRGGLYIGATLLSICVLNLLPTRKLFFTSIGEKTMSIYLFHPYLTIGVYALVYGLQVVSKNIPTKVLIFISPVVIIYILSRKPAEKVYVSMFKPINKVVYSPRIWKPCKKQYIRIKPKIALLKLKILKLIRM